MNESESNSVPPSNSSSPSEPTEAPPQASKPSVAPEPSVPSGSSDSAAPVASPDSASGGQVSGVSEAAPVAGERSAGDSEQQDSDGQKRRRRRRRRRKAAVEAVAGDEGEHSTDSGSESGQSGAGADGPADEAGADGAAVVVGESEGRPARAKKNRPKKERGGRERSGNNERGNHKAGGKGRARRDEPRNDRRRGSKDSQHSATIAVRALSDMAQSLLHIEGVDPLAMPRYLDLQLRVPLDGGNDVRHAAGTAVEQILKRVREVREHEQALRPGAVYSYFSDSSHDEGCRPIEPRHVFDGYSSTGKPKFTDFVTLAIERKDPNIERMLSGEDIVLTHVSMGRVLRTQQLAEFGSNSPVFKILGQVDAGLFRVLGDAGRCAFSFQLLRGATLEGRVRLRLHPVGAVDPMDLADPALMQILSRFQRKLDTEALRLEGKLKGGDVDEEEFVLPLLQDFAKQLQSRTRNTGRRTQHGIERSEEGQRPTSKAYPDAGEASDDSILWDIDQSTIVVLGAKGRVHVFSPQAKHVTSVVMQRPAVERRRQQSRWRLAEPEERGEFRINVKQLIASGHDKAEADDTVAVVNGVASPPAESTTSEQEPKT